MTNKWIVSVPLAIIAIILAGPAAAQRPSQERVESREMRLQSPGWLGISFAPIDAGPATVEDVFPDSPAGRAGLQPGDTIVQWNGSGDVVGAIARQRLAPGDSVKLRVRNKGNVRGVTMEAGERPGRVTIGRGGRDGDIEIRIPDFHYIEMFADSLAPRADSIQQQIRIILADSLGPRLREMQAMLPRMRFRGQEMDSILAERFDGDWADSTFDGDFNFSYAGPDSSIAFTFGPGGAVFGGGPFGRAVAGAEFAEINAGLASYFGTDHGALTLRVAPETPAAHAGLQPGDVVVGVNDQDVNDVGDLREAIRRAGFNNGPTFQWESRRSNRERSARSADKDEVVLKVIRKGKSTELRLGQ